MTTVIVPLDGSEAAESALLPARWIADTLGGSVALTTVSMAVDHQLERTFLMRAVKRIGAPASVRTLVLPGGFPGGAILRAAETVDDPIVCMSTRGQGALATAVIGKVAAEVLSHGELPVVLVGPSFDASTAGDMVIQCYAGGAPLTPSLLGSRCARSAGLEVRVLHVDRHVGDEDPDHHDALAAAAAAELRGWGIDATGDDFRADDVPKAILGLVRSVHPRLLALRRNPLVGRIERPLGRVGIELVRSCPCPVIVDPVCSTPLEAESLQGTAPAGV